MSEEPISADVGAEAGGSELLTGIAHDGPLDGTELTSRRPAGVLLIDAEARQCWLYEWRDGAFYARTTDPMPLLDEGDDNRFRAAEEGQWDVLAAPWVGGDPDEVDADGEPEELPPLDVVDQDQGVGPAAGVEVTGPITEEV